MSCSPCWCQCQGFQGRLFLLPTLSPPLSQTQLRGKAHCGAGLQQQNAQPQAGMRLLFAGDTFPNRCSFLPLADGAAGSLRRALQPDVALGAHGFLQRGAQAALPLHLPLLPPPDLQAEGHEAEVLGGHAPHGHLPLHPLLPLRGVQLLGTQGTQCRGRRGTRGCCCCCGGKTPKKQPEIRIAARTGLTRPDWT